MNYERDYGTNILIVNKNKDKNINYNIVVKPDFTFEVFDNTGYDWKEMEYIEDNFLHSRDILTIDVERIDKYTGFYYGYVFAAEIVSKKNNNKHGFHVAKCILETRNIKRCNTNIKFYLIWNTKTNEYVYIQNNEKTKNPVNDKRISLEFLGLENEIFKLFFKQKPTFNIDMEVFEKHNKFPNKINVEYYESEERHYFD